MARRPALTVGTIVDAAVRVADRRGLAGVTMRSVGAELGVEAMSLYHHLPNKDALLDQLADWVFAQIPTPDPQAHWRPAMVARATAARTVLAAHTWAVVLVESRRAPGPALLAHHEGVLACLRSNGFSVELAAHAFSAIDAYVYGFVLTEATLPFEPGESTEEFVAQIQGVLPPEQYPYMNELIRERITGHDYRYGDEFGFGLDLVLDGLAGHLGAPPG
jgi:AcrR family transcriptional regulator